MSVTLKFALQSIRLFAQKLTLNGGIAVVELGTYESTVISNKSFRTVIPKPVAKALGLQHKSVISWELKVEDGKVLAVVRKV